MPSYMKYWSKDLLFTLRERLESVMRFFTFGEKPLFENDRLNRLRMILDHLNKVMLDVITTEKNILMDESMILWYGRLVFQQYIKNKRHKYEIKFYELCTHDGLVLTVEVSGGQGFNDEHNFGQTAALY